MPFWEAFHEDVYELPPDLCLDHHIIGRIKIENAVPS